MLIFGMTHRALVNKLHPQSFEECVLALELSMRQKIIHNRYVSLINSTLSRRKKVFGKVCGLIKAYSDFEKYVMTSCTCMYTFAV